MVKGWLISLALVFFWIVLQVLVFHLSGTRKLFKTLTFLFLLTLPIYIAWYLGTLPTLGFLPEIISRTPILLGLLNGLGCHFLLYVTYVAFFYYIDRPFTLRILVAFLEAENGQQTLQEIKASYGLRHLIERRLEAMKDGQLVEERDGRYRLTQKGKRLGRLFQFGRDFLNRGDRTLTPRV